ncbi:MAG: hypothetical protein L0177_19885 [Chloroflexi bacterium]|nr:hypothetical protein [Chloroflexota bacterium]
MLKIRLTGPPDEVDQTLKHIRIGFDCRAFSRQYPTRDGSGDVRCYIEAAGIITQNIRTYTEMPMPQDPEPRLGRTTRRSRAKPKEETDGSSHRETP